MNSVKLLFMFSLSYYAQNIWYYQNPIPISSELKEVHFVTEKIGWAIGSGGTLIHTINGGANWEIQSTPLDEINNFSFVDENNGFLIGIKFTGEYYWGYPLRNTIIAKTPDGGENWSVQKLLSVNSFQNIWAIYFIDELTGWITLDCFSDTYNTVICKTTDGGLNWIVQDSLEFGINDIFFVDNRIGWAVGGGSSAFEVVVLKTEDGGENWIRQSVGVNGGLGSVCFIDKYRGWAVGTDNLIISTKNGGISWENITPNLNLDNNQFTSVCFTDSNNGFACGWSIFLYTDDCGQSWKGQKSNYINTILSVHFINENIGWRVGVAGLVQKTEDGGKSWISQKQSFTDEGFSDIDFVDSKVGWVISELGIYYSDSGGESWQLKKRISYPKTLQFLFSYDQLNCWVFGFDWAAGQPFLLKAQNNIDNWEMIQINTESKLQSAFFISEKVGWIVGDSGTVLNTQDGGITFTKQNSKTNKRLKSIDFINNSEGWVVGLDGIVLRTFNGGELWTILSDNYQLGHLSSVDFIDSLHGWIADGAAGEIVSNDDGVTVGPNGVWKTVDGGRTWTNYNQLGIGVKNVQFFDKYTGWASGRETFKTTDAGETWNKQFIPSDCIESSDFIDENTGWLAGIYGTILHTYVDSITSFIETQSINQMPKHYNLYNNFPNPFNPTTTIQYSIPKQSNVTLKVFDVLGSEVTTLVNKEQSQGNYEIEFDGSSVSRRMTSGIYFYRLKAGNFVETKKMILLK